MSNEIGNTGRRGIKESILELRREGKTYNYIKDVLKCSKSTINYHCKNEDLLDAGQKNQEVTDKDISDVFEYTKNHTIKQAMSKFGFGRTTIIRYMSRKGILLSDKTKKGIYDYTKDHTRGETAKHFGVSFNTVVKYRRKDYYTK
jgi:DNA-binding CsgD family transcriptional regulator